jgi:chaperonin GroEL (HSP60 family)
MKLLDIVHPAAKALVDIARSQDNEVGDGTTTVVVLAGELLKEVRGFIEEGVNPRTIVRGYREAGRLAVEKVKEIAVEIEKDDEKYLSYQVVLMEGNFGNCWKNVLLRQCPQNLSTRTKLSS